ncbi:polyketide synthase dehydratase domain-containing protein [Streptomyces sp. NBC_01142]|uniref:type I polyketide synthase n=1 Tax=Streptomyces sp. NBC_01142 TaxID=2975865 RepID=UPI00225AE857|nr:type I polyketide synthase [Streptomyces sp. NBC_01142]MCX4825267.1 polyketide synthase dehydratase domain-containing protein [Streptomyces sp. NBC_01142]
MADASRGPRPTDAAIVGMGAVFPGAADLAAYRRNLVAGTDAITDVPPGRWDPEVYYHPEGSEGPARSDHFYCRRGGFIDELAAFDPTRFGIMPAAVAGAEPDQLLALRVIAEAVADAGGEQRLPADRSRIGVILGRGGFMGVATARLDQRVRTAHQLAATLRELAPELGEDRITAVREAFQAGLGPERPEASIGLVPSFTAARTANRLDFQGPAYTLDAACASSLLAVEQAAGLLAGGSCDLVVAGAVHHCHIATLWSVFTQLRALSPSQRIRPFDRRADGTLLSEGTGVVVLKRLADAERDGDRVYAVVRGTGVAGDGRAASLMSPLVDGQVRALNRAWGQAGLDPSAPDALGLLEAHGTGTPVGDEAELATLARVFGPRAAGTERVATGSVKSMLGHTMQASGMAGLIKAALAVHDGVLPPTLHLDDPHEGFDRTRMRPVTTAEPWHRGQAPRRAGVNAFGFGGINAHVVLEETPGAGAVPFVPVPAPVSVSVRAGAQDRGQSVPQPSAERRRPERTAEPAAGAVPTLLAAATPRELGRLVEELPDAGAFPGAAPPRSAGPCRLVVLGLTPKRRALAAAVIARGKPWRGRGGVWFSPSPLLAHDARLAFLFPGLEPDFAPYVDDVADHFGLARPALTGGDALVERAVDAIAVGRLFARVLPELGIQADLLAGHSLGEWTAMVVAGMYPQHAVDTFLDSLRPGDLDVPDLVYAALGCGAGQATDALRGLDRVAVSHDNCPHQSVLCGEPGPVSEALTRLAVQGVLAQELPFRSGFHTPMWAPYLDQVRAAFARLPLRPPTVPVWSATTGAAYPETEGAVRDVVLRHLLEPVRFRELTARLYAEGVRAFVQMGPGSLPAFVTDTLNGRDHLAVSAGAPRGTGGLDQLRRLAAALWTEGLDPRWELLTGAGHTSSAGSAPAVAATSAASAMAAAPAALTEPAALAESAGPTGRAGLAAPAALAVPAVSSERTMRALLAAGAEPGERTALARSAAPATPDAPPMPTGPARHDSPAAPSGPERGVPVRLDLGSPLVRLNGAAPPLSLAGPSRTGGRPPVAGPPGLLSALDAVLDETKEAAHSVAAAWRAAPATQVAPTAGEFGGTPGRQPTGRPAPGTSSSAPPAPPAHRTRRRLSLETMPYVLDHCVYLQPDTWPEASDRFPVVPMTTLLELAADAARQTVAQRAVTGFDDVRALRWLAVAPPVDAAVHAVPDPSGDGRVRVEIGGCATVTVVLADRHSPHPAPDLSALTRESPPPVSAEALYRDRWMFHGPAFAGVHEVTAVADDGIHGVLRALPAPGALLDAAGQLLGHWMQLRLPADRLVFPASLERVRLYGPPPRDGALLRATARIRAVRPDSVRGDVELTLADGTVWARLEGWTYRRFAADERVWPMKFTPEICGIGEPQSGGWCLARRRWTDPASQELVMRRYLGAAERAAYEQRPPRGRAAWLLGRIAAKDAVRQLLWERDAGPVFPVEIPVGNDRVGRPRPEGPLAAGLRLSLAHKDRVAVAYAHAADVGIDIETVTEDPRALSRIALTADERRLADRLAARDGSGRLARALTALWCAKEAAAKAEGTGLGGRLRQWTVIAGSASGELRVTSPEGRDHVVRISTVHDPSGPDDHGGPDGEPATHVVAWTVPDGSLTPSVTPTPDSTEAPHAI